MRVFWGEGGGCYKWILSPQSSTPYTVFKVQHCNAPGVTGACSADYVLAVRMFDLDSDVQFVPQFETW
jgi:hypothetical protein